MSDSVSTGRMRALRDAVARKKAEVQALKHQGHAAEQELRRLEAELGTFDLPHPVPVGEQLCSGDFAPPTGVAKIALFRSLFRGRDDVFPVLWTSDKSGRTGYAPACGNEWTRGVCEKPRVRCGECPNQAFLPVRDRVILDHLQGRHVVGVYPLLADETCWLRHRSKSGNSSLHTRAGASRGIRFSGCPTDVGAAAPGD